MAINARFNDWVNDGPVVIALRPGQVLEHYRKWDGTGRLSA